MPTTDELKTSTGILSDQVKLLAEAIELLILASEQNSVAGYNAKSKEAAAKIKSIMGK